VEKAVEETDFEKQDTPGQAFISLPNSALEAVSCGVGLRTDKPEDYVLLAHRGVVTPFLTRDHASPAESLAVIVYTREAYLADPEVAADRVEFDRIDRMEPEVTHVMVAVLASTGPRPPRSPERLVASMGGENKEFDYITHVGGGVGGGTLRAKVNTAWIKKIAGIRDICKESIEYHRKYAVVADKEV
jgi:hypothetical protein